MQDTPNTMTRRALIKTTGAGALFASGAFGLPRVAGAQTDAPVERIFRGGAIVTVEEGQPVAEALAIGGGRILAVGTEAEVMALATPETVIHDLEGAAVLPGFVDSHGHFMNAPQIVAWANVSGPPSAPRPRSQRSWRN